jgi:hypothetical protein
VRPPPRGATPDRVDADRENAPDTRCHLHFLFNRDFQPDGPGLSRGFRKLFQDGDVRNVPRERGPSACRELTNRAWSVTPSSSRTGRSSQLAGRTLAQGCKVTSGPYPAARLTVCRARSYQDDRALLGCPYTLARDECRTAPLLTGTKMPSESVG